MQHNQIDLYLTYCGMQDCSPHHSWGPSSRSNYVVHVVLRGKGTLLVNDTVYHLEENQAFLISPNQDTYYYEADEDCPWQYIWIGFNGLKAADIAHNTGFSAEAPVIRLSDTARLNEIISDLLALHELSYINELKRQSLLFAFFSEILERQVRDPSNVQSYDYPSSFYVDYATKFLQENYYKRIQISDLAKYIGINRSYLSNSFQKIMHKSPQEFLLEIRMQKACFLLTTTKLPVKEISILVGYPDQLAFSKIFKQHNGISPKNYRLMASQTILMQGEYDVKRPL